MPLTPDQLPPEVSYDVKDGYYAEKNEAGEIVHFGFYLEGEPLGWVLHLSEGKLMAVKTERVACPGQDDPEGTVDPEDLSYWVSQVIRPPEQRSCSFCQKSQSEVLKLIAGPTCYICNECVELCSEILAS